MAPIGIISGGIDSRGRSSFNFQRSAMAAFNGRSNVQYRPTPPPIVTVEDVKRREAEAAILAQAKKREPSLLKPITTPAAPLQKGKPSRAELPTEIQRLLLKHAKAHGAGLQDGEMKMLEDFKESSAWNRRLCAMATARINRENKHRDSIRRQESRFKAIIKRSKPRR